MCTHLAICFLCCRISCQCSLLEMKARRILVRWHACHFQVLRHAGCCQICRICSLLDPAQFSYSIITGDVKMVFVVCRWSLYYWHACSVEERAHCRCMQKRNV